MSRPYRRITPINKGSNYFSLVSVKYRRGVEGWPGKWNFWLSGEEFIGGGVISSVYVSDKDIIKKVFRKDDAPGEGAILGDCCRLGRSWIRSCTAKQCREISHVAKWLHVMYEVYRVFLRSIPPITLK